VATRPDVVDVRPDVAALWSGVVAVRPRTLVRNADSRRPRFPVRLALALAVLAGVGLVAPALTTRLRRALAGGRFGPEAGLVGVAAVLLGIGPTVAWVRTGGLGLAAEVAAPDLRWRERSRGRSVFARSVPRRPAEPASLSSATTGRAG